MQESEIQTIEINLLLEAMYQRYGYDFRSYARASVERRLRKFLATSSYSSIAELIPKVLHDASFFSDLSQSLSVSTTEMFRDPFVYRAIRQKVLPVLRTWPYFKTWHAGCATGEEVYSMAIVLLEEGLSERATIYATDFNDASLAKAKEGIYRMDRMQTFTKGYQSAGLESTFSDYYHARYDSAVMHGFLKSRMTFANHNLAVDNAFGEMHLILCRNVLIYFNQELQNRALTLFAESLVHGGFLCLGTKESLTFSSVANDFEVVDQNAKIYKKVSC
ncbi:MAG: CheR family methyltransferase [Byssovorax sp.]